MNPCNKAFLERNGINPEGFKVDCRVQSPYTINRIVCDYEWQEDREKQKVSVADIVGTDTREFSLVSIFNTMDNYFKDGGDVYHTRAIGLLEKCNKDNVMDSLERSFEIEPISVKETGKGSYVIFLNGLHRFTILRILYLAELEEAKGDEEKIQELRNKYTIPANVTGINIEMTYLEYLLRSVCEDRIKYIGSEYKGKNKTGNVIITYYSGEKETISPEKIKIRIEERMKEAVKNNTVPFYIKNAMRYKSFQEFFSKTFPDISKAIENIERSFGQNV